MAEILGVERFREKVQRRAPWRIDHRTGRPERQKKTVKAPLGAFTVPEIRNCAARASSGVWFAQRNNGG
jgi:hypothetical protein